MKEKGIKALLFAGVNTDQCVLATIQDASKHGFDTVLLRKMGAEPRVRIMLARQLSTPAGNRGELSRLARHYQMEWRTE